MTIIGPGTATIIAQQAAVGSDNESSMSALLTVPPRGVTQLSVHELRGRRGIRDQVISGPHGRR